MATYVLVHGGGHGGWCYQRVARMLRSAGHEVYTPTMTGLGERAHLVSPRVDLDMHIRDITALLHHEDLREVILVGHSYGGMVITGAADRAGDRVGRIVYPDAANPANGQSLVDVAGPVITAVRPFGKTVDGVELVLLPSPDAGPRYGVTDPGDLAERNHVLPVRDALAAALTAFIGPVWPAGDDRTFLPGGGPVCDESIPLLAGGFRLTAEVVAAAEPSDGVLAALGDWNGGFALFAARGHLAFAFSRAGELLEVIADRPVPPGAARLSAGYQRDPAGNGVFRLYHDDAVVGELAVTGGLPLALQHGGAGLRLGSDAGLPVSPRYSVPAPWNGTLISVRIQTPGPRPASPVDELRSALHAD